MLDILRRKVQGAVSQLTNLNELQAVTAAGVLVSNADGSIGEQEIKQLKKSIFANTKLEAFPENTKGALIDSYCDKVQAGAFTGKRAMRKEIEDVAGDREAAVRVFDAACDVAAAGGVDDKEAVVLREIAGWLGIQNLSEYGL